MNGVAKVMVIGNLGRAPELRHTNSGKAVANFSVAVNSGREDDPTEWIQVVVWDRSAEACAHYLDAGSPVYVDGRWKTDKWTDKEGNERQAVKVIAFKVLFLGRPEASADDRRPPADEHGDADGNVDDSEIPF